MYKINVVVFLLIVSLANTFAQDSLFLFQKNTFHGKRPKIGLVLSGGGAKGFAHVGVLKVLDSMGIKPDFIAGTSMGSIVGGLYAIGFSPDSMETMMANSSWERILSNSIDFPKINMEEKWDYSEYISEFPFKGWKPSLPQGAIKGQELENLFNKLCLSAAKDTVFDNFPIPFRAVSVDILTGNPYVFKTGNLATAMRASMSIPTLIDPVKYRGMLLVDGGLMNNFPVQTCIDMGADIVIGVYTGAELLPEEKLTTFINILKQSSLLAGIKDAERQRENVDIYIAPQLKDIDATQFRDAMKISRRGYDAAQKELQKIQSLKELLDSFPQKEVTKLKLKDSIFIGQQQISLNSYEARYWRFVKNVLPFRKPHWETPQKIKMRIDRLYGTKLFRKLTYSLMPSSLDTSILLKYNVTKEDDKFLTFAIQYKSESKIGVNVGFKVRNFLVTGSKLDLKLRISHYPAIRLRYFTYLGTKFKTGMDFNYQLLTNSIILYNDNKRTGNYVRNYNDLSIALHRYIRNSIEYSLRGGYELFHYNKIIDIDDSEIADIKSRNFYTELHTKSNTLDKKYYSTSGSEVDISLRYYFEGTTDYIMESDFQEESSYDEEADDFLRFKFSIRSFKSLTTKWVWTNEVKLFSNLVSDNNDVNMIFIGGVNTNPNYQLSFWGIPENTLLTNSGLIYRTGLRYNFYSKLYLSGKVNGLLFSEGISTIEETEVNDYQSNVVFYNFIFGGGLQLSYESYIGPISLAVTRSPETSKFWWHFALGYKF